MIQKIKKSLLMNCVLVITCSDVIVMLLIEESYICIIFCSPIEVAFAYFYVKTNSASNFQVSKETSMILHTSGQALFLNFKILLEVILCQIYTLPSSLINYLLEKQENFKFCDEQQPFCYQGEVTVHQCSL